jgi:hypothetical protein
VKEGRGRPVGVAVIETGKDGITFFAIVFGLGPQFRVKMG